MAGTTTEPLSQSAETAPAATPRPLRWWPAAILLIAMAILRFGFELVETEGMLMIQIRLFGPILVALLIAGWWLFFSRAGLREKLLGFIGAVFIGAVGAYFIHFSLQGMGVTVNLIPAAAGAFALAAVLTSQWSSARRLPVVLCATAATVLYWDSIQSTGITGTIQAQYKWRWEKTAEELYLSSLKKVDSSTPSSAAKADSAVDESAATVAEWPSFRGDARDGRAAGIALSENWETQPPREVWRKRIGPGWSSFTVAGPRLFTQEQRGDNEAVVCLDAQTGEEVWSYEYPARFWEAIAGAGPRATPTLADDGVFALGAQGMLVRLDRRSGKLVWKADMKQDSGRDAPMWGFSSSPLVIQGVVIAHAGGAGDKGVFAYDAVTGEKKWSAPSGDHSYSSPQSAGFSDVAGVLMLTNKGLQFLAPDSGEVIWNYESSVEGYRALQPLVIDQSVLLSAGGSGGTRRLEVTRTGSDWSLKDVWTSRDMKPDFNDYVQHHNVLYGFDGSVFASIDLNTGKRHWKKGRYGKGQALLVPDGDQILVLSEQGEVVLLHATPEKCDERARFPGIQGKTWNHPVLIGRKLYLRNAEEAACFELPLATTVPDTEPRTTTTSGL